jgi:alpha-tubulin suppressor-like RCC1 family protein
MAVRAWRLTRAVFPVLVALLVVGVDVAVAAPAGSVFAFGGNYYGQLGVSPSVYGSSATPAVMTLPGESGPVTEVATGAGFSLMATAGGQLYAVGGNSEGQLGNATNNGANSPNPTPTPVALPGENGAVSQLAAGDDFSLVVTSSGQLYAFGDNKYGQLGNATNTGPTLSGPAPPNPTPTIVALGGEKAVYAAAGYDHSLVVAASGRLYAFGNNAGGQLGNATHNGSDTATSTPTLVSLPGASGLVTQVAAGTSFSLALTASGQLYAFGYNGSGQLGNAPLGANPTPALVTLPGENGPITQIAAGSAHTLALTASGQLYAFGDNYYGELGNTTNNGNANPSPTPALVTLPGATGAITQIAAGYDDSFAVTSTGQVFGFGFNRDGALGRDTNLGTYNATPTPAIIALPGGTTVDTVARGDQAGHTVALVSDVAIATGSLPGGQVGQPYSTALSATGGTAPVAWSASGLPPGLGIDAQSGVISGSPGAPGSYPVTVAVTDTYGSQTSQTITLAVAAALPAPTVTHATQTHRTWREAARRTGRRAPVGTTFSFTLNEHAAVTLTFEQQSPGRRTKGSCVAQTRKNRRKVRCTRTVVAGVLSFTAGAGRRSLNFQGRVARSKKLRAGNYTLVITARAGGKTAAPARLSFTIAA